MEDLILGSFLLPRTELLRIIFSGEFPSPLFRKFRFPPGWGVGNSPKVGDMNLRTAVLSGLFGRPAGAELKGRVSLKFFILS